MYRKRGHQVTVDRHSSPVDSPTADPAGSDLLEQSELARTRGDYRTGSLLARRATEVAADAHDGHQRGLALRQLAGNLIRLGDHEETVRCTVLAVQLLRDVGDETAVCESLTLQALAYTRLGMQDEALAALATSLDIAERLGDPTLLFWAYNRLGGVHGSLADYRQGKTFLARALSLARTDLDDDCQFCILNNLGDNAVGLVRQLRESGESTTAKRGLEDGLRFTQDALALAKRAGHPYWESIALGNYGPLLALAGEHEAAMYALMRSTQISVAHGYRSLELSAMQGTAEIHLVNGRLDEAIDILGKVLAMASEPNEKTTVMTVHRQLSAAYEKAGDFTEALRHYRAYHEAERSVYSARAATRARLLTDRFELDNARLEADNARLEAELHRIRREELEQEKRALQSQARESARRAREDQLTGLWNRRHQDEELPVLVNAAVASRRPLCVAVGDVDRFKGINDQFGHPVGDEVLKTVATILKTGSHPADLLTRMGGEEFFLAFAETDLPAAYEICERLRTAVERFDWASIRPELRVTISFGVARLTVGDSAAEVLGAADAQLYEAKRYGRNRVQPRLGAASAVSSATTSRYR